MKPPVTKYGDLDLDDYRPKPEIQSWYGHQKMPHKWDEDGICVYCGFDGAEDWWIRNNLRLEIGDDEYNYRKASGEFEEARYCPKRSK